MSTELAPPTFLTLPLELRREIYDCIFGTTILYPKHYVARQIDDDNETYSASCKRQQNPLALLTVNRQVHGELSNVWLRLVTLDFSSRFFLMNKLRSLQRRTLNQIKNLSVRGRTEGIKVLGQRPTDGHLQVEFNGDIAFIKPIGDGQYWMWVR